MSVSIFHGDIIYSESAEKLSVHEDSYLVAEDGFVSGIYPVLPEEYRGAEIEDYGRGVIIPAFSDMHIHASQFLQRGTGMDKLLFDWLSDYTFPQESRFASMDYAKPVYDSMVRELIKHGTFHTAMFTTIHREASSYLFESLEEKGLYAYIGKVNMDRNSPDFLCETVSESLAETERFLHDHTGGRTVKPMIIPRFAPSVTEELMMGLGKLAKKYSCGLHTHLVESLAEVDFALEMFPGYACDAEIYERCGLLDNGPAIFAHYIFPSEKDNEILGRHDCLTVHCPDATTNITAGIMPVDALSRKGIRIGLGTDIGSGQSAAVYRQISAAIKLSKLKEFYEPEGNARLSFDNAFYLATKAGGSVFDRVGSLERGYRFNALVIDGLEDGDFTLPPRERLERFCYAGDDRNIVARWLNGTNIDYLL